MQPTASSERASLYNADGRRLYVSEKEWLRFLAAADRMEPRSRAFCYLLALTGCRISEALAVSPDRLDPDTGHVVFRTLKRRKLTYRAVPVPPMLMTMLVALARSVDPQAPLWPWSRPTGWRKVKASMAAAGIAGVQATAKGLRHGFAVANAEKNIPMARTRDWMGHADIATTARYQHAVGQEERAFAQRLWRAIR